MPSWRALCESWRMEQAIDQTDLQCILTFLDPLLNRHTFRRLLQQSSYHYKIYLHVNYQTTDHSYKIRIIKKCFQHQCTSAFVICYCLIKSTSVLRYHIDYVSSINCWLVATIYTSDIIIMLCFFHSYGASINVGSKLLFHMPLLLIGSVKCQHGVDSGAMKTIF